MGVLLYYNPLIIDLSQLLFAKLWNFFMHGEMSVMVTDLSSNNKALQAFYISSLQSVTA